MTAGQHETRRGRRTDTHITMAETGGFDRTVQSGSATILAGPFGERLKPLFRPRVVHPNTAAAIIVIKPGAHIIEATVQADGSYAVVILRVLHLDSDVALCKVVHTTRRTPNASGGYDLERITQDSGDLSVERIAELVDVARTRAETPGITVPLYIKDE